MDLAKYIDHTLLKPESTREDIRRICAEAKQYNTASVCVNPFWIGFVAEQLKGTDVTPCCVIGFPLGATPAEVKAYETSVAVRDGAKEVDMVINVGALRGAEFETVYEDIKAVVDAAKGKAKVKVIIETCLLTDEEKIEMCRVVSKAGADFIKTSTGFSTGGATREDVALFKQYVSPGVGIKASGGIASLQDAEDFLKLGATRLGTSRLVKIAKEQGL